MAICGCRLFGVEWRSYHGVVSRAINRIRDLRDLTAEGATARIVRKGERTASRGRCRKGRQKGNMIYWWNMRCSKSPPVTQEGDAPCTYTRDSAHQLHPRTRTYPSHRSLRLQQLLPLSWWLFRLPTPYNAPLAVSMDFGIVHIPFHVTGKSFRLIRCPTKDRMPKVVDIPWFVLSAYVSSILIKKRGGGVEWVLFTGRAYLQDRTRRPF